MIGIGLEKLKDQKKINIFIFFFFFSPPGRLLEEKFLPSKMVQEKGQILIDAYA